MSRYNKYKKLPTILEQFRSFCFQNKADDFEKALEYFCVFGGMGWNIDINQPLLELIENKVLKNYKYINADITKFTKSDKHTHSILSGVALGDRRVHSAIKRARISRNDAEYAMEELFDNGFLSSEYSLETPPDAVDKVDEKLNFSTPFYRFWFAFVSPFFKTIKDGDYKEFHERFSNSKQEFLELIFLQLSKELIKTTFKDDVVVEVGSYWDRNTQIDILAKTKSGKVIAGICKNSKSKAKKTELTKLKEQCSLAELNPDIFVLISKSGFSNELKSQKSEELKLLALKNFKSLTQNLGEQDFMECEGKMY